MKSGMIYSILAILLIAAFCVSACIGMISQDAYAICMSIILCANIFCKKE